MKTKKNKAFNLARSRADVGRQYDVDRDDLNIPDSLSKIRITEEQRKRRNDFYEAQVLREIMGEDLW